MPRDFAKSRSKLIYLSKLGGLVHAEVLIDHRVALGDRLDAAGKTTVQPVSFVAPAVP